MAVVPVSETANYATGTTVSVDGGMTFDPACTHGR